METLKLGYATKNRETDRFLYEHKNIVRMEDTPDGQTIVFAYKHVPQNSPDFIWYSDPRPNGYIVSESMLRLIDNSNAAAALGSISTPKKAASSRENGKLGGRPKAEEMTYELINDDGCLMSSTRTTSFKKAREYFNDQYEGKYIILCGEIDDRRNVVLK